MEKICAELDPVQITKVFLLLLSKEYLNMNKACEFEYEEDYSVDFCYSICLMNREMF